MQDDHGRERDERQGKTDDWDCQERYSGSARDQAQGYADGGDSRSWQGPALKEREHEGSDCNGAQCDGSNEEWQPGLCPHADWCVNAGVPRSVRCARKPDTYEACNHCCPRYAQSSSRCCDSRDDGEET